MRLLDVNSVVRKNCRHLRMQNYDCLCCYHFVCGELIVSLQVPNCIREDIERRKGCTKINEWRERRGHCYFGLP